MTSLQGISSMATRALLTELGEAYAAQGGAQVQIESVGGVDAAKRVAAGEAFDVVILASDAIDKLIAAGHLLAGSRVDIVQSEIAVAIKSGAACAMITPANNLKDSLISAKSISYSTGPSGVYLAGLFEKMGIAEQLQAKTIVPPPGVPVGSLVAKGEAELGFQQLSELINVDGIEVLGTLPSEVAYITTFSAGIPANATEETRKAVKQFLSFCNSPQTAPIKQSQGMAALN
jgi:molybdate transport system substrate-binding protein